MFKMLRRFLHLMWTFWLDTMHFRLFCTRKIDEENVRGKVVIITGANTGIGKQVALEMAKRGATVVMACRDLDKGEAARIDIQEKTGSQNIILMELDLQDLTSVRLFGNTARKLFPQIHILINNAGVCFDSKRLLYTKDGFEMHMGVNHLGHFVLTNLLLDNIKAAGPSRIVVVASTTLFLSDLDLDDIMLEKHSNPTQYFGVSSLPYNNSKLANALFAKQLARHMEGKDVSVHSLCPGLVYTEVHRSFSWLGKIISNLCKLGGGLSVEQGAYSVLYCALSKSCAYESGKFYRFGKEVPEANRLLKREKAEKLWEISKKLTHNVF